MINYRPTIWRVADRRAFALLFEDKGGVRQCSHGIWRCSRWNPRTATTKMGRASTDREVGSDMWGREGGKREVSMAGSRQGGKGCMSEEEGGGGGLVVGA
eukprot:scaffold9913_cov141-Isochrysis_galbana.AAC.2